MTKGNALFFLIITTTLSFIFCFIAGLNVGKHIIKGELEQKLCQLKQYEYCLKEDLLKTIK